MSTGEVRSENGAGVTAVPAGRDPVEGTAACGGSDQLALSGAATDLAVIHSQISEAEAQLCIVVEVTEGAANRIMDACDLLALLAQERGGQIAERVTRAITMIFEACGFQDLTGQRITKVTKTLRLIDCHLAALSTTLGLPAPGLAVERSSDIAMVNGFSQSGPLEGPQDSEDAVDQSAADRLFAQST